jgi:hypothetical protein
VIQGLPLNIIGVIMKKIMCSIALICHAAGAFAANSLTSEEISKLQVVNAGLVCADDTTPTFAMTGLNSTLAEASGTYIVLLDQTNNKLGRVVGGKVHSATITAYPSKDSAIGTRFLACALISN